MPHEILLHIRWYLVPALIDHFISVSASSLERYEATTRHLMCAHCVFYNEYVYGHDIFLWHPCACGCVSNRPPHPREHFRDRHEWLEATLSRKSLWLRGRSNIWEVVTEVVGDFGCEIPKRLGSSPQDGRTVLVVSRRPSAFEADVSLGRLKRDMGLFWDYEEPCPRPPAILGPPPLPPIAFHEPAADSLVVTTLDTITAPLTATLSILTSSLTLFLTVLCYYSRPAALRLY
ncbi:hypothetical protein C8F01DRAFT_383778 [Mycena amicta]|nr:hypothetical protein C8F01DRAFT_383778 [Mycena amicta]